MFVMRQAHSWNALCYDPLSTTIKPAHTNFGGGSCDADVVMKFSEAREVERYWTAAGLYESPPGRAGVGVMSSSESLWSREGEKRISAAVDTSDPLVSHSR